MKADPTVLDNGSGSPGRPWRAPAPVGRSAWLVSFTDLVCLLLAFFVLWFSMSEPVFVNWQAIFGSPDAGRQPGPPGALFGVDALDPEQATNLDYLAAVLASHIAAAPALAELTPERRSDSIRLALPAAWTVATDGSTMDTAAARGLFLLGGVLARLGNRVEIVGYLGDGDGGRTGGGDFRTALGRAAAVAGALADAGIGRPLSIRAETAASASAGPAVAILVRDWRGP